MVVGAFVAWELVDELEEHGQGHLVEEQPCNESKFSIIQNASEIPWFLYLAMGAGAARAGEALGAGRLDLP
jgi:hypothetical protein